MINIMPFQHRNHNGLNQLCKIGEKKIELGLIAGRKKGKKTTTTEKQSSPTAYKQSVAPYPMRG